jgi:hypothetical protein
MSTCDAANLQPGDKLYEVSYYTVVDVDDSDVNVCDASGGQVRISRQLVERSVYSTNQFDKEERVTRTQLAQKIESLGHAAAQFTFKKQVACNDIADKLVDEDLGSLAKRRKVMKRLMDGPVRVMNARLFHTDEFDAAMELGRYRVIDLDEFFKTNDEKRSMRMVDTRTISQIVVDNVRYFCE